MHNFTCENKVVTLQFHARDFFIPYANIKVVILYKTVITASNFNEENIRSFKTQPIIVPKLDLLMCIKATKGYFCSLLLVKLELSKAKIILNYLSNVDIGI